MRKLMVISAVGAVVGYAAVYFAFNAKPAPAPQSEEPVAAAPTQTEPVVLAHVVDVTDTDPLLDPLPGQPAGAPFDATEPINFAQPSPITTPIPPAQE